MKKRLAILAVLIITILMASCFLVACNDDKGDGGNNNNNGTNGTPENGTYDMKVWCAEADKAMIEAMLYDYEQLYPNNIYNWEVQTVGEDDAGTRVIADPTTAADVFSFASDQLGKLVTNNAISTVPSTYTSQIEEQIYVAQKAATYNGSYYAYPYTYENCFLYYNKSLLNANAIGSLETLLTAPVDAEANIGMDMNDAYYTTIFLYTAGVEIFGPDGTDASSIDLNNDKAITACNYIKSLNGKLKFKSIAAADQSAALKNGQIASVISGPHMISEFKTALGSNFGVAKLPTIKLNNKDTQMVCFSGVKLYGVNRNTKYPAESAKLAAFLSNSDNQYTRLNDREFCPTNETLYDEATSSGIETVEVVIEQAEYAKLKPALTPMSAYWTPMASFLYGVYAQTQAQSAWAGQLESVESALSE